MSEYVPMSREGYEKLRQDLAQLEDDERPKIAEKIAEARAEGDLKENAEYHGQREAMALLEARINVLRDKLARASIIDVSTVPKDEVGFGATVRLKDLDIDEEEEITLVGAGDEDFDNGRYNIASPIGQGLLGAKVGQKVDIPVPKGTIRYEILDIHYDL